MAKKGYSFENNTYITPIGTVKVEKVNDLGTEATLSHSTEVYKFTITQ